jgi:hypothetical protein
MSSDSVERPALRIVSGNPTTEEIAAVTVVLAAAANAASEHKPATQVGGWADPALRLRRPIPAGPGAWRSSARL